jgi:hypothetical protein
LLPDRRDEMLRDVQANGLQPGRRAIPNSIAFAHMTDPDYWLVHRTSENAGLTAQNRAWPITQVAMLTKER